MPSLDDILTRTILTTPSSTRRTSWTRAKGNWPIGAQRSMTMTTSPTRKLRRSWRHLRRSMRFGTYSFIHLSQIEAVIDWVIPLHETCAIVAQNLGWFIASVDESVEWAQKWSGVHRPRNFQVDRASTEARNQQALSLDCWPSHGDEKRAKVVNTDPKEWAL